MSAQRTIARSPEDVFDWVADHRHVKLVMEGVEEWRPLGRRSEGVGALFQVGIGVSPIVLRARLEITEWRQPGLIGWRSVKSPVAIHGRWRFDPAPRGTRVELAVSYQPPGGAFGSFLAGGVESVLQQRVARALDRMKEELERTAR